MKVSNIKMSLLQGSSILRNKSVQKHDFTNILKYSVDKNVLPVKEFIGNAHSAKVGRIYSLSIKSGTLGSIQSNNSLTDTEKRFVASLRSISADNPLNIKYSINENKSEEVNVFAKNFKLDSLEGSAKSLVTELFSISEEYQVNDKIKIKGSGISEINSEENLLVKNNSNKSWHLNIDKVSKNDNQVNIEARFSPSPAVDELVFDEKVVSSKKYARKFKRIDYSNQDFADIHSLLTSLVNNNEPKSAASLSMGDSSLVANLVRSNNSERSENLFQLEGIINRMLSLQKKADTGKVTLSLVTNKDSMHLEAKLNKSTEDLSTITRYKKIKKSENHSFVKNDQSNDLIKKNDPDFPKISILEKKSDKHLIVLKSPDLEVKKKVLKNLDADNKLPSANQAKEGNFVQTEKKTGGLASVNQGMEIGNLDKDNFKQLAKDLNVTEIMFSSHNFQGDNRKPKSVSELQDYFKVPLRSKNLTRNVSVNKTIGNSGNNTEKSISNFKNSVAQLSSENSNLRADFNNSNKVILGNMISRDDSDFVIHENTADRKGEIKGKSEKKTVYKQKSMAENFINLKNKDLSHKSLGNSIRSMNNASQKNNLPKINRFDSENKAETAKSVLYSDQKSQASADQNPETLQSDQQKIYSGKNNISDQNVLSSIRKSSEFEKNVSKVTKVFPENSEIKSDTAKSVLHSDQKSKSSADQNPETLQSDQQKIYSGRNNISDQNVLSSIRKSSEFEKNVSKVTRVFPENSENKAETAKSVLYSDQKSQSSADQNPERLQSDQQKIYSGKNNISDQNVLSSIRKSSEFEKNVSKATRVFPENSEIKSENAKSMLYSDQKSQASADQNPETLQSDQQKIYSGKNNISDQNVLSSIRKSSEFEKNVSKVTRVFPENSEIKSDTAKSVLYSAQKSQSSADQNVSSSIRAVPENPESVLQSVNSVKFASDQQNISLGHNSPLSEKKIKNNSTTNKNKEKAHSDRKNFDFESKIVKTENNDLKVLNKKHTIIKGVDFTNRAGLNTSSSSEINKINENGSDYKKNNRIQNDAGINEKSNTLTSKERNVFEHNEVKNQKVVYKDLMKEYQNELNRFYKDEEEIEVLNFDDSDKSKDLGNSFNTTVSKNDLSQKIIISEIKQESFAGNDAQQEKIIDTLKEKLIDLAKNNLSTSNSEKKSLTFKLNPEFLGNLKIELTMKQNIFLINFSATSSMTRHILENHSEKLLNSLNEKGINATQVVVNELSENSNISKVEQNSESSRESLMKDQDFSNKDNQSKNRWRTEEELRKKLFQRENFSTADFLRFYNKDF